MTYLSENVVLLLVGKLILEIFGDFSMGIVLLD